MRAAWPSASLWNSSMISWHLNCSVTAQTLCRRIIHIDMDAFYASVESRDDPSLRGKPLAVGGSPGSRGVVMAANYEARAFGVRSAIPMARAIRLCPQLAIVRPDFARYQAVSQQVMAILRSCTPLVEPLSLDEAYLDVSENRWGDPRPVVSNRPYKSISCEETYARDLSDFQEMASELERMSGQLAASLSRKRLRARTVTIKVRYADFTTVTRSHTAESASNSEKYITDCARTLLARTDAASRPVRLLGVGAHGLEREGDGHPESERLF